jgi:hypothetical protein
MSGVNGVWLHGLDDKSNVNIYNNVIHDCGYVNEGVSRNGGIAITNCGSGITIENNDIIGSYSPGIYVSGTSILTNVNNNII